MSAATKYRFENWVRETKHSAHALVMSHLTKVVLPRIRPDLFSDLVCAKPFAEQGWTNITLLVRNSRNEQFVVRIHAKPGGACSSLWSIYHKEAWAMDRVRPHLPVPTVPEGGVGYFELRMPSRPHATQYAYMVQEFVPFPSLRRPATPDSRRNLLVELGRAASVINAVPCNGFGKVFEPATGTFTLGSWADFIEAQLDERGASMGLKGGILTVAALNAIQGRLKELASLRPEPRLVHQDLLSNWGNALFDEQQTIRAVIDWEFSLSGTGIESELSSMQFVYMRDGRDQAQARRDLEAVLEGYGIPFAEYHSTMRETVRNLMIVPALNALGRWRQLASEGTLASQPWRELFARRSRRFLESLVRRDRTHRSSRRIVRRARTHRRLAGSRRVATARHRSV